MLLFTLCFLQVSGCLSYDIEIEGAVHFNKDLIRRLSNSIKPEELKKIQDRSFIQLMAVEPILRSNKKQDISHNKAADPKIESISPVTDKNYEMNVEPTEDPGKFNSGHIVKLPSNLIHQITTSGSLRLKMLAYCIKNNLNPESDINVALNNATNDYLKAVNAYFVFISKKLIKCDIDKEFIVLDMIETTNKILFQEAKKLLNAIKELTKSNQAQRDTTMLMKNIKNTVLEEKREQLKYVCKELEVCRSFPGYCDGIANMLRELLQLTDKSFKDIIISLNETITLKRDFFKTIMRDNVYNKLSNKLSKLIDNTNFIREVFSIIRSVITQRFKVFKGDSLMIKVKTKAVRILLELIDKAFEVNNNDINNIDISNTISSYKQWAAGDRDDVGMITKKFVYNAVEILNYNWGKETKEEVKVLTDVMFIGGTENVGVYDYLFTKGTLLIRDLV